MTRISHEEEEVVDREVVEGVDELAQNGGGVERVVLAGDIFLHKAITGSTLPRGICLI